jgi:hypothetical protein
MSMRTWLQIPIAACVLALTLSPALAQQTLPGVVHAVDGSPPSFAHVQLQGNALYAAATDVEGKFVVKNFVPGSFWRMVIR